MILMLGVAPQCAVKGDLAIVRWRSRGRSLGFISVIFFAGWPDCQVLAMLDKNLSAMCRVAGNM
jgi:hypothetical protein